MQTAEQNIPTPMYKRRPTVVLKTIDVMPHAQESPLLNSDNPFAELLEAAKWFLQNYRRMPSKF